MTLTQRIKEKAFELGFDLIGIAPAEQAPHAEAYYRWLQITRPAWPGWLVTRSAGQSLASLSQGRNPSSSPDSPILCLTPLPNYGTTQPEGASPVMLGAWIIMR
jgi:hypothetical protein